MMESNEARYITVPKFGPLEIEPEDWKMLVRHVKAYCRDFEKAVDNPDACNAAFLLDIFFVVIQESTKTNRLFLLPTYFRADDYIREWIKSFDKLVAFGTVKIISNLRRAVDDAKKISGTDDVKIMKARKSAYSLEPDTEDVKLSVELDKLIGRPIYYIIMNKKFEYEIYKSPIEHLYGLLQPADENGDSAKSC